MSVTLHIPRPDTRQRRLKADEWRPRTHARLPGGRIADQVACQKLVQLCPLCRPKFAARANGYEPWRLHTYTVGRCDGCQQVDIHCEAFITEAFHDAVGDWSRPRRGRWSRWVPDSVQVARWWASRRRPRFPGQERVRP